MENAGGGHGRCTTEDNRVQEVPAVAGAAGCDHRNADRIRHGPDKVEGDEVTPTRLSLLNKALNGVDLFYNVSMPNVFMLVHPVGSVIGNATYSDFLVVYQNCTIGADGDKYPVFSGPAILYSGSSVIGECHVGRNVVFVAQSLALRRVIPDDSVVTGRFPNVMLTPNTRSVRAREFNRMRDEGLAASAGPSEAG